MMIWQTFSRGMPKSFSSWNKVRWKWKRVVPEEGLEPSQGYPYRILSLVADATKVRRVCKPSEFQASMALVINAIGALAFPHGQNTDNKSFILAASRGYLITLSALASTFGGIVRPICLAVFRLITSSNFVGCSTGSSTAFAPLRILST